jgi:hypothetical protein
MQSIVRTGDTLVLSDETGTEYVLVGTGNSLPVTLSGLSVNGS